MNAKALLEAALFVTDTPLSLDRLSKIVGVGTEEDVKKLIDELRRELEAEGRGIQLVESPEGFELRVKPEYRPRVVKLAPFADLSDGVMRTLAIIAVKQPVKQSIIVKYQGNKTYGYIQELEAKGLVKTEKYGRTKLVTTSDDFEKYFGKSSEEMKQLLNHKMNDEEAEDGGTD